RLAALELALRREDAAGALLSGELAGSAEARSGTAVRPLGALAELLGVEHGYEDAVAAALGPVADAVAVASVGDAVDAIRLLREVEGGRATFVVGGGQGAPGGSAGGSGPAPAGARWAVDLV